MTDLLLGMTVVALGWTAVTLYYAFGRIARIEDVLRKQLVLNEMVTKRLAVTVSRDEMQ